MLNRFGRSLILKFTSNIYICIAAPLVFVLAVGLGYVLFATLVCDPLYTAHGPTINGYASATDAIADLGSSPPSSGRLTIATPSFGAFCWSDQL